MPADADALIDRRRLKRRLSFWRILAVVAIVALIVVAVGRVRGYGDGEHIARLEVSGVIVEDRDRIEALSRVADDEQARALIVHIDSPGGSVVGGESLYRSLRAMAAEKPVVAVMGTLATSAGYMTAVGADHIIAQDGSLTGSIGVLLQTTDVTGLLDKIGVSAEAIKSRPLKAVPSPLEPLTQEGRRAVREVVLDMYAMFVDLVAERRELPRETVLKLADGRVFTGRQALQSKLVDGIGGESEARDWLSEEHGIERTLDVRDVVIDRDDRLWRALRTSVLGKTFFSERLTLDGLVSVWHPDLTD